MKCDLRSIRKHLILAGIVLLTFLGLIMPSQRALATREFASAQEFQAAARNAIGKSYEDGWCLRFVTEFFGNGGHGISGMGFVRATSMGCAYDCYDKYVTKHDNDMNIPVGADVFFDSWGYVTNKEGINVWTRVGHIGIYIGNGEMIESSGGTVNRSKIVGFKTPSENHSLAEQYLGWAWHPNVSIYGVSSIVIDGKGLNLIDIHDDYEYSVDQIDSLISVEGFDNTGHISMSRDENTIVGSYSFHNHALRWNKGDNLLKITYTGNQVIEQYIIHVHSAAADSQTYSMISDVAEYNGHYYAIYGGAITWQEAKNYCQSVGGHLATITTQREQNFINGLNKNNLDLWIGGYQDNNDNWRWVTGEEWSYTNWSEGEPNNSDEIMANESCIVVWPNKWNDLNADNTYQVAGFICEFEGGGEYIGASGDDTVIIASGECGENTSWTLDNHGLMTIAGTGSISSFSVNTPVVRGTSITIEENGNGTGEGNGNSTGSENGDGSDSDSFPKQDIRHVVIENNVSGIGYSAFSGFANLASVSIPSSVTEIGGYAFCGCKSLANIVIPVGTTNIGSYAFYGCDGLKSIILPSGLLSIGDNAFADCSGVKQLICSPDTPDLFSDNRNFKGAEGINVIIRGDSAETGQTFKGCNLIKSVTIQEGITGISDYAFYNCKSLENVTIPSTVTSIGEHAFNNCEGLTGITLPEGLTEIKDYAFGGCDGLVSVRIPSSTTSIGYEAFKNCSNLIAASFSPVVPSLNYDSFTGCDGVNVVIRGESKDISSEAFKNCSWIGSLQIENGVTGIGRYAFYNCTNLKRVDIPSSVKSIEWYAFSSLEEISFSPDVPELYEGSFSGSENGLHIIIRGEARDIRDNAFATVHYILNTPTRVTIESGVTGIGNGSFNECSNITEVFIENGLERIGDNAFAWCTSLSKITIPGSVRTIGNYAFGKCSNLTNIHIPEGVTEIGPYAFVACNLTDISLPSTLMILGDGVFNNSGSISTITLPDNLQEYGSASIPDPITRYATIGSSAARAVSREGSSFCDASYPGLFFRYIYNNGEEITDFAIVDADESITAIQWPAEITMISHGAFYNCSELTSITVPKSVKYIGGWAFSNCTKLERIDLPGTITEIEKETFENCTSLSKIYVPDSVTTIGGGAFYGCSSLKNVHLPINLSEISDSLFWGCSELQTIEIPSGVTSIGNGSFRNSGLTSVTVPENVSIIGENAFAFCQSLASIDLPNKLTSIGEYAFQYCTALETVSVHGQAPDENVFSDGTGNRSFYQCTSLKYISIPKGIKTIGHSSFDSCTSLENITIPDNVDTICECAFIYCNKLETVTIPNYINIESSAFDCGGNNSSLKEIKTLDHDRVKEGNYVISGHAFSRTLLTMITLPLGTQFESGAFQSLATEDIRIIAPDGLTALNIYFANYDFPNSQTIHFYLPKSLQTISIDIDNRESTIIYCYWNTPAANWARGTGYQVVYLDEQEDDFDPAAYVAPVSLAEYQARRSQGDYRIQIYTQPNGYTNVYDPSDRRNSNYDADGNLMSFQINSQINGLTYSAVYDGNGNLFNIGSNEILSNGGNLQKQYNTERILTSEAIYFSSPTITYSHYLYNDQYQKYMNGTWYTITQAEFIAIKNGGSPNGNVPGIIGLPAALTEIESEAFVGLPLSTRIVIPNTVTSIAPDAFDDRVILVCESGSQAYSICSHMGWTVVTSISGQ